MGNREEKLRQTILDAYGSIPKFSEVSGIPKSTVYNVFDRGVENTRTKTMEAIYSFILDEKIKDAQMSDDEAELISMFHKMNDGQRMAIMTIVREMVG